MSRCSIILLLLIVTTIVSGCGTKKPAAPPVVQQPTAVIPKNAPDAKRVHETVASPMAKTTEVVAESLPDPERILLLAQGGPLLIDVSLTIDGRPYEKGLAALIDRVLKAGDTDDDGRCTWLEWSENEKFLQGELAKLNPVRKWQVHNWVERYDKDKDGRIQRTEAASWLGRDGGRSAVALRLRSSRAYFAIASDNSRLWQLLDVNADGQLAGSELENASQRLMLLDTNDDRTIDSPELATLAEQLRAQGMQRRSFASQTPRQAAIHLEGRADASRMDYVLTDLYAPRQQLGPDSFPARPELFTSLDGDGDQWLTSSELERLLEIDPHLKLSIDFASDTDGGPGTTTLTLLDHESEIERIRQTATNRATLLTTDTRLSFTAVDLSGKQPDDQVVVQHLLSLMIHDQGDQLFQELDTNANGRLGEREISVAADRLRECDANGDRQLSGDELRYSMTVAFLRAESPGEQSFYVPSFQSPPLPDATTPAWFRHSDFNNDGDVSQSEFVGSRSQFSTFDTNQDEFIDGNEASARDSSN